MKSCPFLLDHNTHHLSYNDLCNEKPEDLIVLCEDCHYSVHNNGLKPNRNFGNYHINIKHERWIYSDLTPVEYDEGMEKYEKYLEKVKRQQENIKLADMYRRKRAISKLVFWLAVTLVILIGIILTKSIVF